MSCQRCGGFMIVEPFHDEAKGPTICEEALGTRCINCGNVEDAVIQANRTEPASTRRSARYRIVKEVEVESKTAGTLTEEAGELTA